MSGAPYTSIMHYDKFREKKSSKMVDKEREMSIVNILDYSTSSMVFPNAWYLKLLTSYHLILLATHTYRRTKWEVVKTVKTFLQQYIKTDVHSNDSNTSANHFWGLNRHPWDEVVRLTLIYLDHVQQYTVPAFIFIDVEQEAAYGCWQPPWIMREVITAPLSLSS